MSDSARALVILVEFSVPSAQKVEFLELCAFDSSSSVRDEPGCLQFDALTTDDAPELVILYEVYADKAAFDAHLATPHYATFAAGVKALGLAEPKVRFLTRA